MKNILYLSLVLGLVVLAGCSPKIYLLDRQTVLEDEAAGEWPDFEKDFLEKTKAQGPTPFVKTENSAKKERLYNVLNGELTSQAQSSTLTHASTDTSSLTSTPISTPNSTPNSSR